MIQYRDFSLKIEPKRGDIYPVIVLGSPAGEARAALHLPFAPAEIGDLLFQMEQTVRSADSVSWRDVSPGATRTRPQQVGDQLFSALFSGPVRSLFERSLGMIHGRAQGLRIKLHIDPEDESLAQLASLPWEYLYRKETRDFLNLSRFTPIVRYLDVPRPYTPLPLEPPLRILVAMSSPTGYAHLDLERERTLIEMSWAQMDAVQVDFMEHASIESLHERLSSQTYHVLHYMGHGDFDERTGQGVLVLEDEKRQGEMVHGNTLGILLRDVPRLRLVFLNACETARTTRKKGLDPFAGVASALVMAGIPAVVAMQFPISDQAATTFSHKFYSLLARGERVDSAVAEGRRAIRLASSDTLEWGTPVLFMRAPEGIIFEVESGPPDQVELGDEQPETDRPDSGPPPGLAEEESQEEAHGVAGEEKSQTEHVSPVPARVKPVQVSPVAPDKHFRLDDPAQRSGRRSRRFIFLIGGLLLAAIAIAYGYSTLNRPTTGPVVVKKPLQEAAATKPPIRPIEAERTEADPILQAEEAFQRGDSLLHQEKYLEATAHFDEAMELGLVTADLFYKRALACHEWRDRGGDCPYEQAVDFYGRAVELEPENAHYHHQHAVALTSLGDLEAAINSWDRAIELDPENVAYFRERGFRYIELGEFDLAQKSFTHAIEFDARDLKSYEGRALAYHAQGKSQIALSDLNRAIELEPGFFEAYLLRGEILYELADDPTEAFANFDVAVEIAPKDNEWPHWTRGLHHMQERSWRAAVEDMTQVIRRVPEWPEPYAHRGESYAALKQNAKARADYERFLELTQGNPDYRDWQAGIEEWLATHPR